MLDDMPTYYQVLQRYEEFSTQHPQLCAPPGHYRSEACDPSTIDNPTFDDPCHKSNTTMVPYHYPYFVALQIEIHVLSQLH